MPVRQRYCGGNELGLTDPGFAGDQEEAPTGQEVAAQGDQLG